MALRQIALVPLFIHSWGLEYYGSWLVATSIPTMLSMTNVGLGTSANLRIAMAMVQDDRAAAQSAYSLSQALTIILGVIVCCATYALSQIWPDSGVLFEPDVRPIAYSLMVATVFIQMLATPMLGWWTSIHRPSIGYHYFNFLQLSLFLSTIALLISGGNALNLILVQASITGAWLCIFFLHTHKQPKLRHVKLLPRSWDWFIVKELVKKGAGHQLAPMWQALYFQGGTLLAAHILGAQGAALWSSLRTASRTANQATDVISQGISTEIQLLSGENGREKMLALRRRSTRYALAVATAIFILMSIVGKTAFDYWTLKKFDVSFLTWILICSTAVPNSLWWIVSEFDRSTNKPWRINLFCLLSAILSLATSFYLGTKFGIIGFAIAYLQFELVMLTFVTRFRIGGAPMSSGNS